jgi:hypothetical protein
MKSRRNPAAQGKHPYPTAIAVAMTKKAKEFFFYLIRSRNVIENNRR